MFGFVLLSLKFVKNNKVMEFKVYKILRNILHIFNTIKESLKNNQPIIFATTIYYSFT